MKKISESSSYKWWVLSAVQFAIFLFGVDSTIVNLALPTITKDLQVDIRIAQWIISIFLIASAVALPITGRLADICGRKKIFIGGIITLTTASFFCAISQSLEFLIIMRALQGIGCAASFASCFAIMSALFHHESRGLAFGINNAVFSIGMGIGVLGGGYLVEFLGWRSIFFINVAFGLLALISSLIVLLEEKISVQKKEKYSFDYLGGVLFTLAIIGVMSGLINYLNPISTQNLSFILFLSGSFFALFFIFTEIRSRSPLVCLKLYKTHAFTNGSIIKSLSSIMINSILFIIPFSAQESLNMSPSKSGIILFPFMLAQLIFGPLGGHFADKIGNRVVFSLGFLITTLSFVFLIFLTGINQQDSAAWTFAKLITGLLIFGIGIGIMSGPNNSAALAAAPPSQKGSSAGLLTTIAFLSGALATAICSQMISRESTIFTQKSVAIAHAEMNIFYILLMLSVVGIALSYFFPKARKT